MRSVRIYMSWPREKVRVVFRNPFDGMATVYLGLEDKLGGQYDIERHVVPIVSRYFRAATMTPSRGMWKGKSERMVVITLIAYLQGRRQPVIAKNWRAFVQRVRLMANTLKRRFRQEAIMVQFVPPGAMAFGLR